MHERLFWERIGGKWIDPHMLWLVKFLILGQDSEGTYRYVRHMSGFQGADLFGNILNLCWFFNEKVTTDIVVSSKTASIQ